MAEDGAVWRAYDEYQQKTTRDIPVVVLEPAEPRGSLSRCGRDV
ncbi:nitroreductase/quinone reductase family protein [Actinomadura sp. 3N407]